MGINGKLCTWIRVRCKPKITEYRTYWCMNLPRGCGADFLLILDE